MEKIRWYKFVKIYANKNDLTFTEAMYDEKCSNIFHDIKETEKDIKILEKICDKYNSKIKNTLFESSEKYLYEYIEFLRIRLKDLLSDCELYDECFDDTEFNI